MKTFICIYGLCLHINLEKLGIQIKFLMPLKAKCGRGMDNVESDPFWHFALLAPQQLLQVGILFFTILIFQSENKFLARLQSIFGLYL